MSCTTQHQASLPSVWLGLTLSITRLATQGRGQGGRGHPHLFELPGCRWSGHIEEMQGKCQVHTEGL